MNNKPYLSVVVPSYNENKNIGDGKLSRMYDYLSKRPYSFEVILVDDGSTDDTLSLLEEFCKGKKEIRVMKEPHRGKGPTVTAGMLAATGENRLFADFDQATPISEIEKLLPFRKKGYDVVIGSREVRGAKREKEPFYRHLMGKGFNFGIKIVAIRGIQDTQCGFKMVSEKATSDLFPDLTLGNPQNITEGAFTGSLDVELLFVAQKRGYRIAEVPVHWQHVHTNRVSPVKDSIKMAVEVVKIRMNDLMGKYEKR